MRIRRSLLALTAAAALLAGTVPGRCDPVITPWIIAGLTSAGIAGTTAAAVAPYIAAGIVFTATTPAGGGVSLSLPKARP